MTGLSVLSNAINRKNRGSNRVTGLITACLFLSTGCVAQLDAEPTAEKSGNGSGDEVSNDPGAVDSVRVTEQRLLEADGELQLEEDCFELAGTATGLSVTPDGQAWVVLEGEADGSLVQVIDPAVGIPHEPVALDVPKITVAHAQSASEASFSTSEGLWRVIDSERIEVFSPPDGGEVSSFCGDLSVSGALVSGGNLYEMRGERWWQYTPPTEAPDVPVEVVRFDGACTDQGEAHWLAGDAGTIWRVGRDNVVAPVQISGAVSVAGTAGLLGVMTEAEVWLGSVEEGVQIWQSWELADAATPSWLGLAGGNVWLLVESELYRLSEETWSKSSLQISDASEFGAYATGVWSVEGSEACHYSLGSPIQLEGIRPFDRTREQLIEITVQSQMPPQVELNDEPLDVSSDEQGHHVTLRLGEVGWSELSVTAGSVERSLWVKRIPTEVRSWEADIQPIYETSCTGSSCHGASDDSAGPPDLSEFEAWLSYSGKIRSHVVEKESMPPVANRGPEWSDAQRTIISEWLEGGLLP